MNQAQGHAPHDDRRLNEERLDAALAASQVAVFEQDLDLRYTWIRNPALGFLPDEVIGRHESDLFERAEDAARIEAVKRAVLATGRAARETLSVLHDGVERWYDLTVQPRRDAAGTIVGVICAALDTTERAQADRQRALLTSLADAFAPVASADDIAHLSAELICHHFGASRVNFSDVSPTGDEVTVFAGVHRSGLKDDRVRHRLSDFGPSIVESLRAGATVAVDDVRTDLRTAHRADAYEQWDVGSLALTSHVSDGTWKMLMVVHHSHPYAWQRDDLALLRETAGRVYLRLERARADEALRAARDTFRHLVEYSPFGIYAVDADFRLVQVSAGAQRVFENVRPLLGRDFAEVLRIIWSEPFASEAIALFRHTLATGEPYHAPATVERRADNGGTVESYDWKIERVTLPDGRFGVVCHFYDLTERQRYELALREADRQKDEFLAILAHELRNPLAPIRTSAALLRARGSTDPLAVRCQDVIDRQATLMTRLLDDLLDISRLSRGRLQLQRAPLLLTDVIATAIETSRPLIDRQRQHLRVVTDTAEDLVIDGDAARLTQVVANLLNNAAKYSHPEGRIDLHVLRDGSRAVVRIRDEGIGMTPEMLSRTFNLFAQAREALDHAPGGLGIGLALAKRIVEMHGGEINATSAGTGRGSEFTITLPLAALDEPQAVGHDEPRPERPGAGRRVLIVDDNADAADTTALLLKQRGCEVLALYDGESAMREAARFRPDVALLDLGMPKVSGYDVCRYLRQQPWGGQLVVIALSGWGREEDRARTRDAGFDHHLAKPVAPEVLVQLVASAGR